jgi:hypothetical protein
LTVLGTSTSPGPAAAATRAPMWTARPETCRRGARPRRCAARPAPRVRAHRRGRSPRGRSGSLARAHRTSPGNHRPRGRARGERAHGSLQKVAPTTIPEGGCLFGTQGSSGRDGGSTSRQAGSERLSGAVSREDLAHREWILDRRDHPQSPATASARCATCRSRPGSITRPKCGRQSPMSMPSPRVGKVVDARRAGAARAHHAQYRGFRIASPRGCAFEPEDQRLPPRLTPGRRRSAEPCSSRRRSSRP